MPFIMPTTDGSVALAAGRYFIVGRDWKGSFPDPRTGRDPQSDLPIPVSDEIGISEWEGMEMLSLPIGRGEGGAVGRSIAIGDDSIVAFEHIAIIKVPGDDGAGRYYPYASHIRSVIEIDLASCTIDGETHEFNLTCAPALRDIDVHSAGAFSIEGEFIDMTDPVVAHAFDYGSEAFNAALDEHGFVCDLDEVRARLRARTDADGVPLLFRLSKMGRMHIAYYAPVMP